MGAASVLAEVQLGRKPPAKWIAEKLAAAFPAQIEAHVLVDILPDLLVRFIVEPLEDFLELLQVVPVGIQIDVRRIECRIDLDADDIANVSLRIEGTVATVAGEMDHRGQSPSK
jgi:hypothetical protein